jgi:hypothetical protein
LPTGEDIPLGARVLSIADAYDAMVSDRVYRKGRSQEEAFAELRRCADLQFDRELVERFIASVETRYEVRTGNGASVSRQAAVAFGQQIEHLADALDHQDYASLSSIASRMRLAAQTYEATDLANTAQQLEAAANGEPDLQHIVSLTSDLMELCRNTQAAFLSDAPRVAESLSNSTAL